MLRIPLLFLFCVLVFSACSHSTETAEYSIPASDVSVVIERQASHAFLAEYHRLAYLVSSRQPLAQTALLADSGGYSRTNLFRLTETTLLLRDADASYLVDVRAKSIEKDDSRRKEGIFVGSFDVDPSKAWRFIPAMERPELPTEFSGG